MNPQEHRVYFTRRDGTTGTIRIAKHLREGNRMHIRTPRTLALDCNETWDLIETLTLEAKRIWETD